MEHAGWQSIFLINLPLGLLALALGLWGIEKPRTPSTPPSIPWGSCSAWSGWER